MNLYQKCNLIVSLMSHYITWRGRGLWTILHPATWGRSRCFGFTFQDSCGTL